MDEHHEYHVLHPQRKLHFFRKNANVNLASPVVQTDFYLAHKA
jgi:hypothetical protein